MTTMGIWLLAAGIAAIFSVGGILVTLVINYQMKHRSH